MARHHGAMRVTSHITAGNVGVGEIDVDPAAVRGAGGPLQPSLIVPATIRMNSRPEPEKVAVLSLECQLAVGFSPSAQPLGQADRLDLRAGFPVSSVPWGSPPRAVELRVPLTAELVEHLERERHKTDGDLNLTISSQTVIGWLRSYNEAPVTEHTAKAPFDLNMGMLGDVTLFWTTAIGDTPITIDSATWVNRVLPGLGYDTLRLIEVRLPPELDDPTARRAFAKQLRHLDRLGYEESISASRALLKAWEKRLTASRANTVADIVATRNKLGRR
jgi:hypothetical protein